MTQLSEAQRAAAALPALVLAAERIASGVRSGPHGRRRSGAGDAFWQSRPLAEHEAGPRIDWRLSARAGRPFVRETEWEAAQTVGLWHATGPGMDWSGDDVRPTKRARAGLLTLALASLLLRGGERVRLLGTDGPAVAGPGRLPGVALGLAASTAAPNPAQLPPQGRAVLLGDWLQPVALTAEMLRAFAARRVRGVVVQVLDPAELALPYAGRVQLRAPDGGEPVTLEQAQAARDGYAARIEAHRAAVRDAARACGWNYLLHTTGHTAQMALLDLWTTLSA